MSIIKSKYNEILESIEPTDGLSADDIRCATVVLLVTSMFKFKELTEEDFVENHLDLELLDCVRKYIDSVNELYPINVDAAIGNARTLIIKTANAAFGKLGALALGHAEYSESIKEELRPSYILSNAALVAAEKYADELKGFTTQEQTVEISNESISCVDCENLARY